LLHAEVEGESLSLLDYYETTTAIVKPNNDSDVRILVCKNQVQEEKIYEEWLVVVQSRWWWFSHPKPPLDNARVT
jgi:hypothetical protein